MCHILLYTNTKYEAHSTVDQYYQYVSHSTVDQDYKYVLHSTVD